MNPFDRMAIEHACTRLINRFPALVDGGDIEAFDGLFSRDARFSRPSEPDRIVEGLDAIKADFRARAGTIGAHIAANIVVEVVSDDRAVASSHILAVSRVESAALRIGMFDDEFAHLDGEWRIAVRRGKMLVRSA